MKILVTGGAGFIGSHLVDHLLARGDQVTVIDDLSTGSLENLAGAQDSKNFKFVKDSVRNSEIMHLLIDKCEQIYHLAAAVGVRLIVDRPVHTIETNIHGTEVVLETANKFGKKVLIASTSEVYGKSEKVPFVEDDDSVLGSTRFLRWSYACSKAIDEFLALAYHRQYGLDVVIARLFNTIGPRQSGQYGMVVPRFVAQALKNEPLSVYGTGAQCRCFTYVGDVIEALVGLMAADSTAGEVYNIGSDQEISIDQLARKIIEKTHSSSTIEKISYQQAYGRDFDDMQRRVPCLEKIKKAVGFVPRYDLDRTLDEVIAEMKTSI